MSVPSFLHSFVRWLVTAFLEIRPLFFSETLQLVRTRKREKNLPELHIRFSLFFAQNIVSGVEKKWRFRFFRKIQKWPFLAKLTQIWPKFAHNVCVPIWDTSLTHLL